MNSESVPAYMNVGKDFFCWAEAGGRRTKNEPISEEEHLVNPSIPKMEVLDACFKNSIKENVFQLYIFKICKRFKIFSAHER